MEKFNIVLTYICIETHSEFNISIIKRDEKYYFNIILCDFDII